MISKKGFDSLGRVSGLMLVFRLRNEQKISFNITTHPKWENIAVTAEPVNGD